jgi:hypothetical protein
MTSTLRSRRDHPTDQSTELEAVPAAALPGWLPTYNHHRSHTALGRQSPIGRTTVNNAAGHYS